MKTNVKDIKTNVVLAFIILLLLFTICLVLYSKWNNEKIDVNIIVEYGARIPDVAFEIQTRVKKSVETMTGLKVLEVNVHVQGVHAITEKEKEQEESEE